MASSPTTTLTFEVLDSADPAVAELIRREHRPQSQTLELIPSENLASPAILEALGTLLTNKYAEGYPGRRYYGGCGGGGEIEARPRPRQPPPPRREPGQRRRVPGHLQAGRPRAGHGSQRGRPPDPRQPGELQRQAVRDPPLRRRSGERPDRLRRGAAARRGGAADD